MNGGNLELLYEESIRECMQTKDLLSVCREYARRKVVERMVKEDPKYEKNFEEKVRRYLEEGFTAEGAVSRAIDDMWSIYMLSINRRNYLSEWEMGGINSRIQDCIAKGYSSRVCEEAARGRTGRSNLALKY